MDLVLVVERRDQEPSGEAAIARKTPGQANALAGAEVPAFDAVVSDRRELSALIDEDECTAGLALGGDRPEEADVVGGLLCEQRGDRRGTESKARPACRFRATYLWAQSDVGSTSGSCVTSQRGPNARSDDRPSRRQNTQCKMQSAKGTARTFVCVLTFLISILPCIAHVAARGRPLTPGPSPPKRGGGSGTLSWVVHVLVGEIVRFIDRAQRLRDRRRTHRHRPGDLVGVEEIQHQRLDVAVEDQAHDLPRSCSPPDSPSCRR